MRDEKREVTTPDEETHSFSKSAQAIFEYLETADLEKLKEHMDDYEFHPIKFKRDFHLIPIYRFPDIYYQAGDFLDDFVPKIKEKDKKDILRSESLYEFFKKIHELSPKNTLVNDVLSLIRKKSILRKIKMLAFGSLIAAILVRVYTILMQTPSFLPIFEAVKGFLLGATGLPIIGLGFTVVLTLYSLYQNSFGSAKPLSERMVDNIFTLATGALNVAGYVFWIGAAAVITPLAGGLFVAAYAVEIVKEIKNLIQDSIEFNRQSQAYKQYVLTHPITEQSTSDEIKIHNTQQRLQEIHSINALKHRTNIGINLGAAVLLTAVIAVWCFVPGGVVVTAIAMSAMFVVYAAKTLATTANENKARKQLLTLADPKVTETLNTEWTYTPPAPGNPLDVANTHFSTPLPTRSVNSPSPTFFQPEPAQPSAAVSNKNGTSVEQAGKLPLFCEKSFRIS